MSLTLQQAYGLMLDDLDTFVRRVPLTIARVGRELCECDLSLCHSGTLATGYDHGLPCRESRLLLVSQPKGRSRGPIHCVYVPVNRLCSVALTEIEHYAERCGALFFCSQLSNCTLDRIHVADGHCAFRRHLAPGRHAALLGMKMIDKWRVWVQYQDDHGNIVGVMPLFGCKKLTRMA
ncbi:MULTISPECIES: hypothetical protein [Vibrio]|uniref:Uncharacterized protein n=1 Tax=Vibrio proteolyticus NBRC 13287 TaxID=1219065 RepID=U3A680_VIBPR|nr:MULTISPECIES: hypothetical protein [Vibrio]NAW57954.1 hypothetical protein [Vibrio sp. V36_P2S2PM302]NAX25469.1 hypothetical protein [Vibrio sp. V38_P2S17PM301]NAX28592.1 hypothetical protein [Vibrio sp. V37_P2S8PM304]GAD68807.1 hypothetical protein VPR01S_19_00890 [Vibrio proteolyticus NBRC 13287]